MVSWKQVIVLGAVMAWTGSAAGQAALKNPVTGSPKVQSLQAISFGPQGLLLIGDGKGKQVIAVDTGDTAKLTWTKTELANIKAVLVQGLNSPAKNLEILKLAVNPASQRAYFAVRVDNKKDILLTVDGTGKAREFSLDKVKHVAVPLPADQKVSLITDLSWGGDRVLVSTQAAGVSKIFSLAAPLASASAITCLDTRTYHVGHRAWETNAPIRTVIPYQENGQPFLVGAYTCTPIVKYPLTVKGPKVEGISVIELGPGNMPQDMFIYEKNGKKYILISHKRFHHEKNPVGPSPYWAAKVDFTILQEAVNINEKALWRTKTKASVSQTDRAEIVKDYHGVVTMDRLDSDRVLMVWTDDKGKFDLRILALP